MCSTRRSRRRPGRSRCRACAPIPERGPLGSAAAAPTLLRARGLARRYGDTWALRDVDLELGTGEAVGLLGPNGAGKTTLLGILAGVTRSSAGEIALGEDARNGAGVGWVPQRPAVYRRLSARENLRLFAALERRRDPDAAAQELLRRGNLEAFADRRADRLSTGTLARLNLCVALAGEPSVLLLDEPAATLSPEQRVRMWGWLEGLRAERGLAMLFSTQSVDEAARHADRLLVLVDGRLAFTGSAAELAGAAGPGGGGAEEGAGAGAGAAERAFLRLIDAAPASGSDPRRSG